MTVDADVLERFLNRHETQNYAFDLNDTKNLIYLNLYNNLTSLFKSKGQEVGTPPREPNFLTFRLFDLLTLLTF